MMVATVFRDWRCVSELEMVVEKSFHEQNGKIGKGAKIANNAKNKSGSFLQES
jgi:hypothetical protein